MTKSPIIPPSLRQDRYQLLTCVGKSYFAKTYDALDRQGQRPVIIKELSFKQLDGWKSFELFQREAKILSLLKHPAIPRLLDFFEVTAEQTHHFYLVQQKIPGENLRHKLEQGWHPTETQAKDLARQALSILTYLHRRSLPVIHRDIKPSNLMLDATGKLWLIDFGAVQDLFKAQGGSTLIGTFGYMPLEQMSGRTQPASDLYSLAATLIHLLSGTFPGDLPQDELRLVFDDHVNCSWAFRQWLRKLSEPMIEDRFQRAAAAHLALAYVDHFGDNFQGRSEPSHQRLSALFADAERHSA